MSKSLIAAHWLVHSELTVREAAALIAGLDPDTLTGTEKSFESTAELLDSEAMRAVHGFMEALVRAINARKLKANMRHVARIGGWGEYPSDSEISRPLTTEECSRGFRPGGMNFGDLNVHLHMDPDWASTTVDVRNLKVWLAESHWTTGFFFQTEKIGNQEQGSEIRTPDILDKNHPRYSVRLAAAVRAWQVMEDEKLTRGRKPKAAIEAWLTDNFKELGLVHTKSSSQHGYNVGEKIQGAISDIGDLVNWDKGGPARTPGN